MELEMLWILSSNLTLDGDVMNVLNAAYLAGDRTGQFVTLPGDFCLPENLVWVIMGVSKTTVAIHRRVQRIVDSFITGQGKSICNMSLCRDSPDAQKQVVGRGHSSRVTPLLSSWSSCSTPPLPQISNR